MNKLSTDVRLLITINNLIYYFHIIQLYELFLLNNMWYENEFSEFLSVNNVFNSII